MKWILFFLRTMYMGLGSLVCDTLTRMIVLTLWTPMSGDNKHSIIYHSTSIYNVQQLLTSIKFLTVCIKLALKQSVGLILTSADYSFSLINTRSKQDLYLLIECGRTLKSKCHSIYFTYLFIAFRPNGHNLVCAIGCTN